jgi:hypothetical protein
MRECWNDSLLIHVKVIMKSSYVAADGSVLSFLAQVEEESHFCMWVITGPYSV